MIVMSINIIMNINNFISNTINNFVVQHITTNISSWFSTLHLTGAGLILIAIVLAIAGKKIMSGLMNIIILVLLLLGIASILGINLLNFL